MKTEQKSIDEYIKIARGDVDMHLLVAIVLFLILLYISYKNNFYYFLFVEMFQLFRFISKLVFKYKFFNYPMEKEIVKTNLEFMLYVDGEWYQEKFYCYPSKDYLESEEIVVKFQYINNSFIWEVSEIVITETNEVVLKIKTVLE